MCVVRVCCMCVLCDDCVLYVCVQIHMHLCALLRGLHRVSSSAPLHLPFWGTYWYGQTDCQWASGVLFYGPLLLWGVTVLFHCLSVDRGTGVPNSGPQICSLCTLSISPGNQRSPSLPSLKNKIRQNKGPNVCLAPEAWVLSSPHTFTTHPSFDIY